MTDIHSHIIFGVDDGARDLEESIELLKKLKSIGFNNVLLTPHYMEGSEYTKENQEKLTKLNIIKEELNKRKININIFLGNEIFLDNNLISNINNEKIYSLNNSNYILVELSFNSQLLNLEDILYELKIKGYIPILAHPERYTYFQKNYSLVDKLKEEGILFQCNYSSIIKYYGRKSYKLMKYMLKNGYVDYLGTDIHRKEKLTTINKFTKIEKKIIKYIGEKDYKKIIRNCDNLVK